MINATANLTAIDEKAICANKAFLTWYDYYTAPTANLDTDPMPRLMVAFSGHTGRYVADMSMRPLLGGEALRYDMEVTRVDDNKKMRDSGTSTANGEDDIYNATVRRGIAPLQVLYDIAITALARITRADILTLTSFSAIKVY